MDFQYERIVVAIDGSEASEKAFKKSLEIAKRNNNARLILAHVVDSRAFATIEVYDRTLTERAEEYAKELLDEHVESAKQADVDDLVRVVEYGSPKVKIPKDIAKDFDADLIVCGATGMNAMERFLIGSVSESITRYATCDVLVVR